MVSGEEHDAELEPRASARHAARARRAREASLPRTTMTWCSAGLALRPVSATRAGCATSLNASPCPVAHDLTASSRAVSVHDGAPSSAPMSPRRSFAAAGTSAFSAAFASITGSSRRKKSSRSAASMNVCARSRMAGRAARSTSADGRSNPSLRQEREDPLDVLVVGDEPRAPEVLVLDGEELLRVELPVAPCRTAPSRTSRRARPPRRPPGRRTTSRSGRGSSARRPARTPGPGTR